MKDYRGRKIDYARISVTNRCNLSCSYCRPEGQIDESEVVALPLEDLLRIGRVLASLGIEKIKLTGGEPTTRTDLLDLLRELRKIEGLKILTLTTNGHQLASLAPGLKNIDLDAVNISLNTLNPDRYFELTRGGDLFSVLEALSAVQKVGLKTIKINVVPLPSSSDEDLLKLASLAQDQPIHVRFIEMMPIGFGRFEKPTDNRRVMTLLEQNFGPLTSSIGPLGNGPAAYYHIGNFVGTIGFISPLSACFCQSCNRLRITADGFIKSCLHMDKGLPLPLDSEEALRKTILSAIATKPANHLFSFENNPEVMEQKLMSTIGG